MGVEPITFGSTILRRLSAGVVGRRSVRGAAGGVSLGVARRRSQSLPTRVRKRVTPAVAAALALALASPVAATDVVVDCEWYSTELAALSGFDLAANGYVEDPVTGWWVGPPGCIPLHEFLERGGYESGGEEGQGLPTPTPAAAAALPDTALPPPPAD
jgi:hypothetical protein